MSYVTQQAVLQEAGLWFRVTAELPAGVADGSNKTFVVERRPIVDRNNDDQVDPSDVTVYVDGLPVTVAAVDADSGSISLVAAPADGAEVTVDYAYGATGVSSWYLDDLIDETEEWINISMASVTTTPYKTVPKTIRRVARVYAAGLVMTREYALQTTEDENKSGFAKLKQAQRWLDDYRKRTIDNAADVSAMSVPRSRTQGNLFQRFDETSQTYKPLRDEPNFGDVRRA